jgi:hypothetical protein
MNPMEIKNYLLKKREAKELTQEEFDIALCMWTLEDGIWQDIHINVIPEPPKLLVDYRLMTDQKKKEFSSAVFHDESVVKYLDDKSKAEAVNSSHVHWLNFMQQILTKDRYPKEYEKITEKIKAFEMYKEPAKVSKEVHAYWQN